MAGFECHAEKYGLSPIGTMEAMEGSYTRKGCGQKDTVCSSLSSFPVGDHTKTNTNKQSLQKELEQILDVLFMNWALVKEKKKNLNKIKNWCAKNDSVACDSP